MSTRLAQILTGLLLWLTAGASRGQSKYTFQPPQTVVAHNVYDLHVLLVGICAVIFVVVFGLMFYVIVKHRRSVGHQAKQFDRNTGMQLLMTAIPCLIIVGLAYPATKTVIEMKDT